MTNTEAVNGLLPLGYVSRHGLTTWDPQDLYLHLHPCILHSLPCLLSQLQVYQPPSRLFSPTSRPLHAAFLGICTPFSPANTQFTSWVSLRNTFSGQLCSSSKHCVINHLILCRMALSPYTGWNFNKFTSICDINNPQDKAERECNHH